MLKSVMRQSSGSIGSGGLPTTSGHKSGDRRRLWNKVPFFRNTKNDGSAASIKLQTPIVQQWKRSTLSMKISYIILVVCIFMIFFGWRLITFNASIVHVNCSSTECYFKLRIVGRKFIEFTTSRSQFLGAKAIKTNKQGKIIQSDVNLNEEWKTFDKGERGKNKKNINTYKGPDKNGHYLSYALYIRNMKPKIPSKFVSSSRNNRNTNNNDTEAVEPELPVDVDEQGEVVPERHLSHTLVSSGFMEHSTSGVHNMGIPEYCISIRQYNIFQTRRKIRNMISKIDSYIKRRRHKLYFKEAAAPDWRGILMMVFGVIGFLLSILLGVFWDEEYYESTSYKGHSYTNTHTGHWGKGGNRRGSTTTTSGPGARKKWPPPQVPLRPSEVYGGSDKKPAAKVDPYSRATPVQYEVSMQPNVPRSRSIIKKSNSTTTPIVNGSSTTGTTGGTTASSSSTTNVTTATRRRK